MEATPTTLAGAALLSARRRPALPVDAVVSLFGIHVDHAVATAGPFGQDVYLSGDVPLMRWQPGEILTVTLRGLGRSGADLECRARVARVRATSSRDSGDSGAVVVLRLLGHGARTVAERLLPCGPTQPQPAQPA
jgi:hypothetical protein